MWPWAAILVALPIAATAPDWSNQVVGTYVGRITNSGQMQCEQLDFSLHDGALVGHYHVADKEPFDGELTNFKPDGAEGGWFTWTDRYGSGVRYIRFAHDFSSFYTIWGGALPDPRLRGYGLRGADAVVPGCSGVPTS